MIPDAAVEAAAQALRDAFDWGIDGFEEQAKTALEAAAPHLMASVWNQGLTAGIRTTRGDAPANPYELKETQ